MRILGFKGRWPKLDRQEFTTFRYERDDTDWAVGEKVQIVVSPRRKGGGDKLGIAEIINKEQRALAPPHGFRCDIVTDAEAVEDGFSDRKEMVAFMQKTYGWDYFLIMNKLTLKKIGDW